MPINTIGMTLHFENANSVVKRHLQPWRIACDGNIGGRPEGGLSGMALGNVLM